MAPHLLLPSATYRASFVEALHEFHAAGDYLDVPLDGVDAYLASLVHFVPTGTQVPQTTYWLVDEGEFIGRLAIRHRLNDKLLRVGGHIGYDIRPGKRLRGYGLQALQLGLVEARKLGIERFLLTCDATNTGSRRIIEANGGVLEDEHDGKLRYWIAR